VLAPYLLITLAITGIMWASRPFAMLPEAPADGQGLNPLLQNYWMAIHPPILFTGFTTMAGPFAFAVAALWRRDYNGWVSQARPWTLLAWACLGSGLALGGFWAYESLGWGGFWGWDPVENSSLVPWLLASALLHGLLLQGARGTFKRANLALAISGYLSVIYSTFLTRSGILGDFSVHSFVELGLMGYLVVFIVLFAALGAGLLAWRWREIERRVLYSRALSREFALVVGITLFVVITLIVGIGTSMPVISLLPLFASQVSVDLGWYGPNVAPFGLLVLLTMAVGPLLGWQRSKHGSLLRALRLPAALSAVAVAACLLVNINYPLALVFIAAAVFAAAANALVIARIWRAGPLKLGGYLCHVGVGLLFLGIVGTSLYKQTSALQLVQDAPQSVFGRQFTFRGMAVAPNDPLERNALQIEVTNPQTGQTWLAHTPYYEYAKSGQLVTHPDIQSGWLADLYIAPSQFTPPSQLQPGMLLMLKERVQQVAGYTLTFKGFEVSDREAMMRGDGPMIAHAVIDVVAPDGSASTVKPALRVEGDQPPEREPVSLPGGATATLLQLDPATQTALVQIGGVDLSAVRSDDLKARAFVEVSYEPGIRLVWLGIVIGVLGGLLAMLRRWREARPATSASGARQPQQGSPGRVAHPEPAGASIISNREVA
jgi:cytochrome c-type biogenesis protein CcmF